MADARSSIADVAIRMTLFCALFGVAGFAAQACYQAAIPSLAGSIAAIVIYIIIAPFLGAVLTAASFLILFRSRFLQQRIASRGVRMFLSAVIGVVLLFVWFEIHIATNWGFPQYNYGPGP